MARCLFFLSALLMIVGFASAACPDVTEADADWIIDGQPDAKQGFFTPIAERVEQTKILNIKQSEKGSPSGSNKICFQVQVLLNNKQLFWIPYSCQYDKISSHYCDIDTGVADPLMKQFPAKLHVRYVLSKDKKFAVGVTCLNGEIDYYYVLSTSEKLDAADQKEAEGALKDRKEKPSNSPTALRAGRIVFDKQCTPVSLGSDKFKAAGEKAQEAGKAIKKIIG